MNTIDIKLPISWRELDDRQLRYVFRLFVDGHSDVEVKTLFLLHEGGIEVITKMGAVYVCKYGKETVTFSSLQIAEMLSHLGWLDGIPNIPVRLSRIGRHKAVAADLSEVPLSSYIILDNLYQGYLHTQDKGLLVQMAQILYDAPKIRLSEVECISVFYWFASVKQYFASIFRHFFQMEDTDGVETATDIGRKLQDAINNMIRALTGGDITKEKAVLEMDCIRALTELDAKAKDYEDLKKK